MYSLFTNEPSKAGYRLEYMEIFNWGTFDKDIFRISPAGNNSLLTGANGSGKTTYVDALLTLLVPIRKYRFYNRSSGTDKKNERTEESYIRGAYGEAQEEGKLHSKTLYLREDKKKVYSILLAVFTNTEHQSITLFQARWFYNGELKRVYGICRRELSIADHFRPFDPAGEWKKALKRQFPRQGMKDIIEFYDSGVKYADRLVKHFGMLSEKALSLFNQTVGIKVLGNLDHFIRTNMLEPQAAAEEFYKLKENYETLREAHRQIEKATAQTKLLNPIRDLAQQMEETGNRLKELESAIVTGNVYFNHRREQFLAMEIEKEKRSLISQEQKIRDIKQSMEECNNRITDLSIAIERDETGRRLKEIDREIKDKEKEKNKRKARQEKYNKLADLLGYMESPGDSHFNESIERAHVMKEKNAADIDKVKAEEYTAHKAIDDETEEYKELEKEILQLRSQKNKITGRVAEIRMEILKQVQAAPDEIPFIGELIKVKDAEKEWEPAIERLLHNFAQRLLVPDKYYDRVNRYVNENNLRGRIVYHRVKDETYLNAMQQRPPKIVLEKLDLKQTVYRDWVENQMLKAYNYLCVEDVSEFHKYDRALTMRGLIKNKDHHQKDDRTEIVNRERYVLGWDNKEKIMALVRKAQAVQKDINQKKEDLKRIRRQLKQLGKKQENLIKFLEHDNYSEIDWQTPAMEIESLAREKKRLEETSDRIKQLQLELTEIKNRHKQLEREYDQKLEARTRAKDNIGKYETEKAECREEISASPLPEEQRPEHFQRFEEAYADYLEGLTFRDFHRVRQAVEKRQNKTKDQLHHRSQECTRTLSTKMNVFKNPGPEITDRFHDWRADTVKLSDDPQFVDDYITLLEKIEKEALPTYRKKFEDYLSSTMINKIAGFNEFLDEGEESIRENIEALNRSLQKISFKNTPATYIQLKSPNKKDVEIDEFKKMLREAIPDVPRLHSEDGGHYKKEVFNKIKDLIAKLDDDENWRKKVIDVRNYKNYYAQEYYRENNEPMKVYKDMGKLSGGEKAQLTYTILGSAIAYQFGIKHKGLESNSFRFIAVDETFSNQDDERANYLMDLCRQLHLQLLVVTPSDKIHIVEPYISYVHYVQRRSNRNSVLFDMPIKQFQEQKDKIQPPPQEAKKN